ncbi:hypothetical protein Tco_1136292 [Tanacetum coccineum]
MALVCHELVTMKRRRLNWYIRGFHEESKDTLLLQSLRHCMRQSTWPVNCVSARSFRARAAKESGKAIKEMAEVQGNVSKAGSSSNDGVVGVLQWWLKNLQQNPMWSRSEKVHEANLKIFLALTQEGEVVLVCVADAVGKVMHMRQDSEET